MRLVIVLLIIFNLGCHKKAVPTPLDLPVYEQKGKPIFYIHLEGDSFFYENKKIERDEIKKLFIATKNNHKEKENPVVGLRTTKNSKMENVVFVMELGQREGIDLVLKSVDH